MLLRMSSTRSRLGQVQRQLIIKRDIVRSISASVFSLVNPVGQAYARDVTDLLNELLRTVALSRDSLNQMQVSVTLYAYD